MFAFLKNLFSRVVKAFKSFIELAFPMAKQLVIAALKDYAIATVTELANSDLSSEEKRALAWTAVQQEGKKRALNVGESLARVITEIAYQAFKEM